MNRRSLVIGGLLACTLAAAFLWWTGQRLPTRTDITRQDLEAFQRSREAPGVSERRLPTYDGVIRLAIGPLGIGDEEREAQIAALLLAELGGDDAFELVERTDLDAVLHEAALGSSGAIDRTSAVRLGSLVQADWFLFASPAADTSRASSIARIVDANTGVIHDVTVWETDAGVSESSLKLAEFARRARSTDGVSTRTFVAVGEFENIGADRLRTDLPNRIKATLATTLPSHDIVLLERQTVKPLLAEIRMSLAGFIDASSAPAMQSAFWLIDGFYRTDGQDMERVNLMLRVEDLATGAWRSAINAGVADAPEQVAEQVIRIIDNPVDPYRRFSFRDDSEADVHVERAEELLQAGSGFHTSLHYEWNPAIDGLERTDPQELRNRLLDAINVAETALLIEPDHAVARLFIARCFMEPVIDRIEDARDLYLEIIGSSADEEALHRARLGYAVSFMNFSSWRTAPDVSKTIELIRGYMETENDPRRKGRLDLALQLALGQLSPGEAAENPDAIAIAEAEILERLQKYLESGKERGRVPNQGEFNTIARMFPKDDSRETALHELAVRLSTRFPDLTPYIHARLLQQSIKTNGLVSRSFLATLDDAEADPESVFCSREFFKQLIDGPWHWGIRQQADEILLRIGKTHSVAVQAGAAEPMDDGSKVRYAHVLHASGNWTGTLELLESLDHLVVDMSGNGPWGDFRVPFVATEMIADCRVRLGLETVNKEGRFSLPSSFVRSSHPFVFTVDGDFVWVAGNGGVGRFHQATKELWKESLAAPAASAISDVTSSRTHIWIATQEDGLFALDKQELSIRRFGVEDGLHMNKITSLHASEEQLWIGYGSEREARMLGARSIGALGVLDIGTSRFRTFTSDLPEDREDLGSASRASVSARTIRPPQTIVAAIARRGSDELWMTADRDGIKRHRLGDDDWTTVWGPTLDSAFGPIATSDKLIAVGSPTSDQGSSRNRHGGVTLIDPASLEWTAVRFPEVLPHTLVSALAFDEDKLWIGGRGYLCVLDAPSRTILKTCLIRTPKIDRIQITGDSVWVQVNGGLHSLPRNIDDLEVAGAETSNATE